jgi:hypothetical protein
MTDLGGAASPRTDPAIAAARTLGLFYTDVATTQEAVAEYLHALGIDLPDERFQGLITTFWTAIERDEPRAAQEAPAPTAAIADAGSTSSRERSFTEAERIAANRYLGGAASPRTPEWPFPWPEEGDTDALWTLLIREAPEGAAFEEDDATLHLRAVWDEARAAQEDGSAQPSPPVCQQGERRSPKGDTE